MKGKKETPKQPPVFKTDEEKIAYLQKLADYYGVEADFQKPEEPERHYLIKYPKHAGEHFGYMESLQDALSDITAVAQRITGEGLEDKLSDEQKQFIDKYIFKDYWKLPPEEVNFDYYEDAKKYVIYLYGQAKKLNSWLDEQLNNNNN